MGTKKGLDQRFKNINYYGTETLSEDRFWRELPFRVQSIATVEDFSNQTGWTRGSVYIFPNGTIGRETTYQQGEMYKNYASPLQLKQYIVFDFYADANDTRLYLGSDGNNTFSYRLSAAGFGKVIINVGSPYSTYGTPSLDNIKYMSFQCRTSGSTVRIGNIKTYSPKSALCTISIDDSYDSDYTKAYEYMKTKNMRGSSSLITNAVGDNGRLSIPQIKEMQEYGWEFVSHGTDYGKDPTGLSDAEFEYNISRAMEFLKNLGAGKSAHFYVPHLTDPNNHQRELLKKYATVYRDSSVSGLVNIPVRYAMKNIGSYMVLKTRTVADVITQIDKAIQNKQWLILVFHRINETLLEDNETILTETFNSIIDYLDSNKSSIKTVTFGEALYYG